MKEQEGRRRRRRRKRWRRREGLSLVTGSSTDFRLRLLTGRDVTQSNHILAGIQRNILLKQTIERSLNLREKGNFLCNFSTSFEKIQKVFENEKSSHVLLYV